MRPGIAIVAALFGAAFAYFQPDTVTHPTPSGNYIRSPSGQITIQAGKPFQITWNPSTAGNVSILLLQGPATNIQYLATIADETVNNGTYIWKVDPGLGPNDSEYAIEIVAQDHTYQYSVGFSIAEALISSSSSTGGQLPTAPPPTATSPIAALPTETPISGGGMPTTTLIIILILLCLLAASIPILVYACCHVRRKSKATNESSDKEGPSEVRRGRISMLSGSPSEAFASVKKHFNCTGILSRPKRGEKRLSEIKSPGERQSLPSPAFWSRLRRKPKRSEAALTQNNINTMLAGFQVEDEWESMRRKVTQKQKAGRRRLREIPSGELCPSDAWEEDTETAMISHMAPTATAPTTEPHGEIGI